MKKIYIYNIFIYLYFNIYIFPMKNLTKSEHQEYGTHYLIILHPKTEHFQNSRIFFLSTIFLALENIYDVEDPRTWKSVCIKCNSARSLMNSPLTCCF
jgi:hypothetical protein